MIQTISVKCSAHDASISLDSIYSYENSLISLRIIDVPKKIGTWDITNVYFSFQNGNEIVTKEAVKTNGVYVVTVNENVEPMTSWYRLSAKGIDENGEVVEAYNLGQGDITILDTDGTIHIDGTEYYVHLIDELTDAPKKGDLYHDNENFAWKIFDGEEWKWLGEKPLPIATNDTVGVLKASEDYITLSADGTITGLSSDYARKVDDDTEGLENYAKKSELKKPVFSCTCINNSDTWKTHTISFYKFVFIEGDKVKYNLLGKDVVVKANSSVRYYVEIPEETQGISTNTGYTINLTYCDNSGVTQTAYEVNDINVETHPNINFSKDIVATWSYGTITTPIATTDTVGGIRATETYISLNDDGDIISLKANHSDSAYEAQVANEAKYAQKVDDNTIGLSAYVKKSELDVGVTKITAGSNISISPTTGKGDVTISAVIPSLSVATNTTLGGLKATSKYITLSSDGTITRLDCDTAMVADTANRALTADDANFATNANEASHALTADNALTADHALTADYAMTADYALTADHAYSSDTALTADNALTAYNAMTADYALTAETAQSAVEAQNASWASHAQEADYASQAGDLAQTAIDTVIAYTDSTAMDSYAYATSVVGRIKALESGGGGGGEEGDESLIAIYLEYLESDFIVTSKSGTQMRLRDGSYILKRSQVETIFYDSMVIGISIDGYTSSGGTFQKGCLVMKTIDGKNYLAKNNDYNGSSSFDNWTATRLGALEGVTFHIFGDFTGIYLRGDS